MKDTLLTIFHGFAMSVANSVPGVSGGTIGFILGFYDRLINSLHNLLAKDKAVRKDAWIYVIKLACGLVPGLILCLFLLAKLFNTGIYPLSFAFIGLTVVAIPFVAIGEKECLKGKYYNLAYAVLGAAIVVGISILRDLGGLGGINFANLSAWQYLYVFVVGAIAISAMILPGISGSTLLLIFGVYEPVIEAATTVIKDALQFHFDFKLISAVAVFCIGIVVGIVAAVKGIKVALEKFRSQSVYMILGLMAGSVYAIMKGPTTLDEPKAAIDFLKFGADNGINVVNVIGFVIGVAVILGLEFAKMAMEKNGKKDTENNA